MIGRSILNYLPVNMANVLTAFGTIAVLTRLLDPAEFGTYAVAMITMQFFHMTLFTWMEAAMVRFQARAERENDVANHLKTIYRLAFVTGIVGFTLTMLVLFLSPLDERLVFVLAFALSATCLHIVFSLGMEAHKAAHRIKRYSIAYSTKVFISFSLGILFIFTTPLQASAPFLGIICGLIIVGGVDLLFMMREMRGGEYQPKKAKSYFVYGAPLCVGLLLSYALNSADVYFISAIMGSAPAGEYSAGYNLAARSLEILFVWVSMAVTPVAITAMEQEGLEETRKILKGYGATLLWLSVPAAVGIALVSEDAGFILGEGVRDGAISVMPWIAFAGLISGYMTYYIHRAFMLSGKTHKFVWALVLPVILNLVLNAILIPKMGLMGAVWSTIAAYILAIILAAVLARQDFPLPLPIRAAVEIFACSAAMAGAVMVLPLDSFTPGFFTLTIKASVGITVYLVACWVINASDCRSVIADIREKLTKSTKTSSVDAQ
ncbi:MAG: lipopolysaccharide biosynthesis protein [Litorimonas sp.]